MSAQALVTNIHPIGPGTRVRLRLEGRPARPGVRPGHLALSARDTCEGARVLELGGELDIAGAGYVLSQLLYTRGPVVVDLARLTFIDSSGVAALLAARHKIESRGDHLELRRATQSVRQVFDLVGAGDLLGT